MKTSDDIKYCTTDGVPNESLIKAIPEMKVKTPVLSYKSREIRRTVREV